MGSRERHIRELAAEMGVRVELATHMNRYQSYSLRDAIIVGWAEGPTFQNYLIALHELGHCAHDAHWKWPITWCMESEAEAWVWALDHSREGCGEAARAEIRHCLEGHIQYGSSGGGPVFESFVRNVVPELAELAAQRGCLPAS